MWWFVVLMVGWLLFCAVVVLTAVIVGGRARVGERPWCDDDDNRPRMTMQLMH